MKKMDENLSQLLEIEPLESAGELVHTDLTPDIADDAEFARQNIRGLIAKGNNAVEGILHVAKESEHPRAYEVAANLIKHLSDLNKDLLEIQKRKKDLAPQEYKNSQNINVDKAVFVGSTTELVKFLKSNK
jgi:hypothetical protein